MAKDITIKTKDALGEQDITGKIKYAGGKTADFLWFTGEKVINTGKLIAVELLYRILRLSKT